MHDCRCAAYIALLLSVTAVFIQCEKLHAKLLSHAKKRAYLQVINCDAWLFKP